jgi:adenylate kinase
VRALFIGPTGVNMRQAVSSIADLFYARRGLPQGEDKEARRALSTYFLEDFLRAKVDWVAFLSSDDYKWQEEEWRSAFSRMLRRISDEAPQNAIVGMNLPFFNRGRFFPAFDLAPFRELKPDVVVTLFEEEHVMWRRVQMREERRRTGAEFRLKDILAWRNTSILLADIIARELGVDNYVVAVKHPVETFYRLLFEPHRLRVYLSFPITGVREDRAAREEIDRFRGAMHARFIAFDPLTVDERALRVALSKSSGDVVEIRAEDVWNIPPSLSPASKDEEGLYPVRIPRDQAEEVLRDLDNVIRYKDYRFIQQSDAVAAYRPFRGKSLSRGMFAEINYAINTAHKRVFVYWPKEDWGPGMESPFDPSLGVVEGDLAKLIRDLEAYEEELRASRG